MLARFDRLSSSATSPRTPIVDDGKFFYWSVSRHFVWVGGAEKCGFRQALPEQGVEMTNTPNSRVAFFLV